MAVRAEEITNIIKDRIQSFGQPIQTTNVGTVIEVHDGVARIYGLSGALSGELLEFPGGIAGLALNLEEDTVGAVLLGDESGIKEGDVVCVYVAIGQKASKVATLVGTLERFGKLDNTIIVAANATDAAALQYIAPYAGCAMAEHFLDSGRDVLIVYDDLTKHAWAYRQMSLLLRRPPGREAYPGDVFYLHSRMIER